MNTAGVAISTTGHEHRMEFLETAVAAWWMALASRGLPTAVFVTVDGDDTDKTRVARAVVGYAEVIEVDMAGQRKGVAASKNTGLEALMAAGVDHLFLADDDIYPRKPAALDLHIGMDSPHSLVCWGLSRLDHADLTRAVWNWPRGVMLHATRRVVETVGGMDERFGTGGHEHAEWSQRIHNAGLTTEPFVSPAAYARGKATGAGEYWEAADMRRENETIDALGRRRAAHTTIVRTGADWKRIHAVMDSRAGSDAFVDYRSTANGRRSATLFGETVRAEEPGDLS